MAEAAAAGAPSTGAGVVTQSAPGTVTTAPLTSVPAGPDWSNGFKDDVKSYISQKGFKTAEDMAVGYQNLEKLRGVPEDRLLKLPEKMEGDDARAVWEKLGAPKEAKGYELPRNEKAPDGGKFTEWAEQAFHENNLTKNQAQGLQKAYDAKFAADMKSHQEAATLKITQDTETLKKQWGARYDENITLAKQGAKILGLDAKTIDIIEANLGRKALFENLHKLGVSVGEATFVDGTGGGQPTQMTPEQAQAEINNLLKDQKFTKKVARGDKESTERWNQLNQWAAPGDKQIG